MSIIKRASRTLAAYVTVLMLLWVIVPADLYGAEPTRPLLVTAEGTGQFTLTVHERLLSLRATDASIKEILEEIGRRMHIEVVARLTAVERMTLEFDQLPMLEAIKRFSPYVNYVVLEEAAAEPGKITKIIVLPKQAGSAPAASAPGQGTTEPARPESFRFELNPSEAVEKKP